MDDRMFSRMWTCLLIVICAVGLAMIGLGSWVAYLLLSR